MKSLFYNTISQLRLNEEIILYDKIIAFTQEDELLVKQFLQIEYDTEKIHYPYTPPIFDDSAALWAAKTLYLICQFILHRSQHPKEIHDILTTYNGPLSASSILSADLCLRFIPQALKGTKTIDPDDELINIVEQLIKPWHYSTIGYDINFEIAEFETIEQNQCLLQLYTDRVIEHKDNKRLKYPVILQQVKASLGLYSPKFWKEINTYNNE